MLLAGVVSAAPSLALLPGLGAIAHAEADSDVAIDATVTVKFDERGNLAAIGERWTFGYDYSVAMRSSIDTDRNGVVDPAEVRAALSDALSWMGRAGYLTRVTEGGRAVALGPAGDVAVSFPIGRLVVDFTLPLVTPAAAARQLVEVSDPDLYYEVHYGAPDFLTEGQPDYCSVERTSTTGSEIAIEVRCR
jgi:hypothetical protein